VRLIDDDPGNFALLLERCEPGLHLSTSTAKEALEVLIDLLPRLWIDAGPPFVSLLDEATGWAEQLPGDWEKAGRPFDIHLLDGAIEAVDTLKASQGRQVLIHQDLHADNVLRAEREPWLVIDPKPLVGEREFSLSPIVRSSELGHSRKHVVERLDKLTQALGLNRERARLWAFAHTLSWSLGGDRPFFRNIETAQWLWQA
jgi:streptomycin 6-kinase